jgi:hypothetical protein
VQRIAQDVGENSGPLSYANWRAHEGGSIGKAVFEYNLFSDSMFYGAWRAPGAPYELLASLRETADVPRTTAAVLRVRYSDYQKGPVEGSTPGFHGGFLHDEVVALASLLAGVRLKAGRCYSRRWYGEDSLGEPIALEEPLLVPTRSQSVRRHRPNASLGDLEILATFPLLDARSANALVLAARSYQEALWIADVDPGHSWLLMVAAVEAAASRWSQQNASPIDRMKSSRPDLHKLLLEAGGLSLATAVAEQIADYMGATRKFRDFLIAFMPPPPAERPAALFQIPWESAHLKHALEKIYGVRSRALHGAISIPAPMLMPLIGVEERPMWVSSSDQEGRTWWAKDVVMLYHTFEHIVRGAILKWWSSMVPESGV